MFEAIALVASIIAIVVGIIEFRRYLNESEADRKLVSTLITLAVVVGIAGYGLYFLYFGPKSTGDKFLDALQRLDANSLLALSCEDSELQEAFGGFGGTIFSFGSLFATLRVEDEIYIPIANEYRFSWSGISGFAPDETHSATIYIRAEGFSSFCVDNADGL
jgi:hypothetical protein